MSEREERERHSDNNTENKSMTNDDNNNSSHEGLSGPGRTWSWASASTCEEREHKELQGRSEVNEMQE